MGGKKGISFDEKRKRILDIYYDNVSTQKSTFLRITTLFQKLIFQKTTIFKFWHLYLYFPTETSL